ncbi:MAG: Phosphoenolpyruvate synthase/pyruvate phosphate dikinase [Candidatus Magasanikbacteria bacterium GW2011_GWC2_37_14]|uniref:Phosphoenolpyruvate synthase/pyruvate phosphate dikinase n=1 Tax=Candidatus Magasanikbacteria bacterium GW2011_GWC2_37_14 TaxID=1619046 RepID=A0A0G0JJE5_9BACT|nr:MAG: Phosphoenolpyruvate synthase/pyruvate phosphate dikinase [Candidatus Magasanikbacteria bacterium GW2011_GWC2_37_14]
MAESKLIWEEITRRGENHALLLIDTAMEGFMAFLGLDFNKPEFKPQNFRQLAGARWFGSENLADFCDFFRKKELANPGALLEYANEYKRRIKQLKDFVLQIKDLNWSEQETEVLFINFSEYLACTRKMWAFAYNAIITNKFLPDLIFAEIAKKEPNINKQNEDFNILLQLEDSSETRQEKFFLLNLAKFVEDNGYNQELENLVSTHLCKFAYLGQYYFRGELYNKDIILERIKEVLNNGVENELQKIKQLENDLSKRELLINELDLPENILKYIESARAQASAYSLVDEVFTFTVVNLKPLFNEIARRLGMSYKQLIEMRGVEILDSLNRGELILSLEKLNERVIESAIILEGNKVIVLSGKKLEEYKKQELKIEKYENIIELSGQGASPGVITGIVKLVLCDADAKKVNKGDILIAPATNPTLVPAMERAGAIVTDEGGLLSHAAIVSRELGIPCLVGTKIGTKVFKDGDIVEVDIINGIIRKL